MPFILLNGLKPRVFALVRTETDLFGCVSGIYECTRISYCVCLSTIKDKTIERICIALFLVKNLVLEMILFSFLNSFMQLKIKHILC